LRLAKAPAARQEFPNEIRGFAPSTSSSNGPPVRLCVKRFADSGRTPTEAADREVGAGEAVGAATLVTSQKRGQLGLGERLASRRKRPKRNFVASSSTRASNPILRTNINRCDACPGIRAASQAIATLAGLAAGVAALDTASKYTGQLRLAEGPGSQGEWLERNPWFRGCPVPQSVWSPRSLQCLP
jgi:hypothetical protein